MIHPFSSQTQHINVEIDNRWKWSQHVTFSQSDQSEVMLVSNQMVILQLWKKVAIIWSTVDLKCFENCCNGATHGVITMMLFLTQLWSLKLLLHYNYTPGVWVKLREGSWGKTFRDNRQKTYQMYLCHCWTCFLLLFLPLNKTVKSRVEELVLAISADVKSLSGMLLKMTLLPVHQLFLQLELSSHWLLAGQLFDSTLAKSRTASPSASLHCQTGADKIKHAWEVVLLLSLV